MHQLLFICYYCGIGIYLYICISNFTENFQKQKLHVIHFSIFIILAQHLLTNACWIDE